MSKLEFKPQDRQSIDFAEKERKKAQEKGATLHANELDDYNIEKTTNKKGYWDTSNADSRTEYPSMSVMTHYVRGYGFRQQYTFDSEEQFLDWVKNNAPIGCYTRFVQIGGTLHGMVIHKVSSSYGAVLQFGYAHGHISLNRLNAGNWGGFQIM